MNDVLVRRCELTLHGRGGWGWGPEPRRYIDQVLPAIDRALQQAIAEAELPNGADIVLTAPVQLRWRSDHTLEDTARQTLVAALRDALSAAPAGGLDRPRASAPSSRPQAPPAPGGRRPQDAAAVAGLLALLGAWSRTGRLPWAVSAWPEDVVVGFVVAMVTDDAVGDAVELEAQAVGEVAATVLAQASSSHPALGPAHRWLVVLGALVAAAGDRPLGPGTIRRAARAAGVSATIGDQLARSAPPDVAAPWSEPAPAVVPSAADPAADPSRTAPEARAVAVPGLPFLMLVQLARLGYLDAVWAIASTTADPDTTCAGLVGGLVGKVVAAPQRGWRRQPEELAAVHAATGRHGPTWDQTVDHLRRVSHLVEAPLRTALTQLYSDPGPAAVELTDTPHGLVIGERAGTLPIAWLADRHEVEQTLHQLGDPACATTALFAPLAETLHARRSYPGADLPGLERHLGAAVGTALGSLAVALWGATADAPGLALDRLGDLEVEVRSGSDGRAPDLTVAVPRGRRWLDLGRAGLLDRWPIPWASAGWELVSW